LKLNQRLAIEMKPIADELSKENIHGYVHIDDLINRWKDRPLTNNKKRTRVPEMIRVTHIMRQIGYERVRCYVYRPIQPV